MPPAVIPLIPRNPGGPLRVVAIGRVSTIHQDVENIEASHDYVQEYLSRLYRGALEITLLGEQASGMLTDRATIRQAEQLVASGTIDLVIAEDLGRIYRNPRYQYDFVQNAVDVGTRVICIGDHLDTADDNWEVMMGAAALRHGLYIPDTRRRVRRTATHSFHRGGMVQKVRYGYRKLSEDEARSGELGPAGLRITKRPECTEVICAMMDRVLAGQSYAAVADWLNQAVIAAGPYVTSGRWSARLIVELLEDPILSGTRTFRDTICQPVYRTGKHRTSRNGEPETEHYPELAHLSLEQHDRLRQEIVRRRQACLPDHGVAAPRRSGPRSRSLWPGQAMTCGICGALMYYSGRHLKCKNALSSGPRSCWNHVQVPVALTRCRLIAWLMRQVERSPELRVSLEEAVWAILDRQIRGPRRDRETVQQEIRALDRRAAHLAEAIAEGGELKPLVEKLQAVESQLASTHRRLAEFDQQKDATRLLSKQQFQGHLEEHLHVLIGESYDMADLLRAAIVEWTVQPVQALDSGLVRPRARFVFWPGGLAGLSHRGDRQVAEAKKIRGVLDLFDPPIYLRHLEQCLAAKRENPRQSPKAIATQLGINHMAVRRALGYAELMQGAGLSSPYRELHEPPAQASRWRDCAER